MGGVDALVVGNLDSTRNIIHASDVASAIRTIMDQDVGDTYLICGDGSYKIVDLVTKMYANSGIELENRDGKYYDVATGKLVLRVDETLGADSMQIHIRGEATKLKGLGWTTKISVDGILEEVVNI
jgi:GDP-D-mannose dehydratase